MKNKAELRLIAPDKRIHKEPLFDLFAKTFSRNRGYWGALDYAQKKYFMNSHYDWKASRIGLIGDALVTHFGVWNYQMRIGRARVKTGGIGAVATHNEYRRRGLLGETARASIDAMRESGYGMSVLFGLSNFYHKYGYVRSWSPEEWTVPVADLPTDAPTGRLRTFVPNPRDELAKLYNRCHRHTTGTALHPTFSTQRNLAWTGVGWADDAGVLRGYVLVEAKAGILSCFEYAGGAEETLRVLAAFARRKHCHEVRFSGSLPYDSPLGVLVRKGTAVCKTFHSRCGAAMVCTLSLAGVLRKMEKEISHRLRQSPMAKWKGMLLIADSREKTALRISGGSVQVVPVCKTPHAIRGGDAVAQLLLGTDDPQTVAEWDKMRMSGDGKHLLRILFPNQHPMLHMQDHY